MKESSLALRDTARILLLDPHDRLLMMSAVDGYISDPEGARRPGQSFWFTPGGAIEAGESVLEAARRELREETGLIDAQFGPVIWYGEQTLLLRGVPTRFRESFVVARSERHELSSEGWQEDERTALSGMRWWTADELRATPELVLPSLLRERVSELPGRFARRSDAPHQGVERIELR